MRLRVARSEHRRTAPLQYAAHATPRRSTQPDTAPEDLFGSQVGCQDEVRHCERLGNRSVRAAITSPTLSCFIGLFLAPQFRSASEQSKSCLAALIRLYTPAPLIRWRATAQVAKIEPV